MNLINALQNLGLNEKEAKVYLALLQLGQSTAYVVASRSGIKKPTAYVVLNQLVEKGFVKNIPRAKKQLFVAELPELLISSAEEKINATKGSLPELMALRKGKGGKTSVAYFQGMNGIRQVYEGVLKKMRKRPKLKREYVAFYAHQQDTPQELLEYFDEINEQQRKHGIKRRGITVHHPTIIKKYLKKEVSEKFGVEVKALSKDKYSSRVSIEIFDSSVHIFSHRNMEITVIDNLDVAEAMKQIFEMIWDLVEKDKKNYLKFSSLD